MQTRREALIEAGLAVPGRGKFSNDAKKWLDAQRAAGVTFSDDNGSTPAPVQSDTPDAPVKVPPGNTPYLTDSEYRFPESDYKGIDPNGKPVSLRECCNTCRVSLLNHGCDAPFIHGNVEVRIVRKRVVNAST